MILQALVDHYEDLLEEGKISRPGWGKVKVSFGLNLDEDGDLTFFALGSTTFGQKDSLYSSYDGSASAGKTFC